VTGQGIFSRALKGRATELGEEALAAAWAEGRAMSLEQAVGLALARELRE
jgi:hypothetical protein